MEDEYFKRRRVISEYDETMETRKWFNEVPYLRFPSDWEVQITPPFSGATARFRVKKGNADISVYLDCYSILGCYGEPLEPYWEIYPYGDKEDTGTFRCEMADTKSLLEAISKSIEEQTINP